MILNSLFCRNFNTFYPFPLFCLLFFVLFLIVSTLSFCVVFSTVSIKTKPFEFFAVFLRLLWSEFQNMNKQKTLPNFVLLFLNFRPNFYKIREVQQQHIVPLFWFPSCLCIACVQSCGGFLIFVVCLFWLLFCWVFRIVREHQEEAREPEFDDKHIWFVCVSWNHIFRKLVNHCHVTQYTKSTNFKFQEHYHHFHCCPTFSKGSFFDLAARMRLSSSSFWKTQVVVIAAPIPGVVVFVTWLISGCCVQGSRAPVTSAFSCQPTFVLWVQFSNILVFWVIMKLFLQQGQSSLLQGEKFWSICDFSMLISSFTGKWSMN